LSKKYADTLNFHLWDYEAIGKNKPLGEVDLPLGPLVAFQLTDVVVPIQKGSGELTLKLQFLPHFNIPPPGEDFSNASGAALKIGNAAISLRPKLCPSKLVDVEFAGVRYHIEGENVPVLTVEVLRNNVFFEHNILLWKHPSVAISVRSLTGAFKRLVAGLPVFLTEAGGQGSIAFSRDGPGQIVPLHMGPGQEYQVREHQFLAATGNLDYSFRRVQGFSNIFFGNQGFFIDTFKAKKGEGIVWLHAYGNLFNKYLAPGEVIEVEPGGWVYMDSTVSMDVNVQSLSSGLFGSFNFITNRFTGPGNVGIQSMYLHMPTAV